MDPSINPYEPSGQNLADVAAGSGRMLRMRIWDITGNRSQEVEAPDNVPIERLLVVLVERMNLPLNSPDGQIMSYKLHHKRSGQQLLEKQTLHQAGVCHGDDLRLQPEITAGAWGKSPNCRARLQWQVGNLPHGASQVGNLPHEG
jgi:hypothetical protein